jgi:hypothetical protein
MKYSSFNKEGSFILHLGSDNDDSDTFMRENGFIQIYKTHPHFYVTNENICEILIYSHVEKEIWLLELWDNWSVLFQFFADNERDKFLIFKEFLEVSKNLCIIEKNLHDLEKSNP